MSIPRVLVSGSILIASTAAYLSSHRPVAFASRPLSTVETATPSIQFTPAGTSFGCRSCAPRHRPSSSALSVAVSKDLEPGVQAIQDSNSDLLERLEVFRDSTYFRLYSVDILASCEYIPQELFECYTESCEIYPVDEEEVRAMDVADFAWVGRV